MDLDKDTFYNTKKVAILPMGFCHPGKGKSGDLPPRKECASQWDDQLLRQNIWMKKNDWFKSEVLLVLESIAGNTSYQI